jgi:two-component system chemotaxis sensor kinase CheA
MAFDIKKYKDLFCAEAEEQTAALAQLLLALEKNPGNQEYHRELMRNAHTIKGAAATMGYVAISALAHALEDVFHAAEKGTLVVDAHIISLLLSGVDVIASSVAQIKESGIELPQNSIVHELHDVLTHVKEGGAKETPAQGGDAPALRVTTPDTIKVSIDKLDILMGLFEDMLMLQLKIDTLIEPAVEFVRTTGDPMLRQRLFVISELESSFSELRRLLSENQDALLAIRLVPLEQIFGQFPRMVRDLSLREKKTVDFKIEGGEIALDRKVIEGLGGALSHLLRNAIDHGIEATGTITLSAVKAKDRVLISVLDSGRGVDYGRVKEVALARKVAPGEDLAVMTNAQLCELLFHPNMSTSEVVTDISGRGVGLSAVRWFAEDVGGHVGVESPVPATGTGTRFFLDLPISLATVRVLTLQSRGYTFAIPFEHIQKTLQFYPQNIGSAAHQATLDVDGEILPYVQLEDILKLTYAGFQSRALMHGERSAVLVRSGGVSFVLGVDQCTGEQELLVKSLPLILRGNKVFSGSALLPDGRTILLLDGHGLLTCIVNDILKTNT